jgi:hypothetical protein
MTRALRRFSWPLGWVCVSLSFCPPFARECAPIMRLVSLSSCLCVYMYTTPQTRTKSYANTPYHARTPPPTHTHRPTPKHNHTYTTHNPLPPNPPHTRHVRKHVCAHIPTHISSSVTLSRPPTASHTLTSLLPPSLETSPNT